MIRTPAHKQTDPNKFPGIVEEKKKLTFDEWYYSQTKNNGLLGIKLKDLMEMAWETAQENV